MSLRLLLLALCFITIVAGDESEEYLSEEEMDPDCEEGDCDSQQPAGAPKIPPVIVTNMSLDERIRGIMQHFKQDDPLGVPGVVIADPFPLPVIERDLSSAKLVLNDAQLWDTSKFRVDYIRTDLKDLKVWISITFPRLQMLGRYGMSSWLTTSTGDFNITLVKVRAEGFGRLTVDPDGILQATNISLDLSFYDIKMKFDNLGFMANILQGAVNSFGSFIFNSVKPMILTLVDDIVKGNVNTQMRNLNYQFPESIPPLDTAMTNVREKIKERNMDPFQIPELAKTLDNGVVVRLSNGTFRGLSTIHRSGDIQIGFENNSLIVTLQVATQRLFGEFNWQLETKLLSPKGKFNLQIDSLDIKIGMSQSANVEKKPKLEVAQLRLGNIHVRSSGAGTMDYIVEFAVNLAFNSFRGIILKAIEKPVTSVIQAELDKLDLEAIIEQKLADWAAKQASENNIDDTLDQ